MGTILFNKLCIGKEFFIVSSDNNDQNLQGNKSA